MCPEGPGYAEVACHPSSWCSEASLSWLEVHREEKLAFWHLTLGPRGLLARGQACVHREPCQPRSSPSGAHTAGVAVGTVELKNQNHPADTVKVTRPSPCSVALCLFHQ